MTPFTAGYSYILQYHSTRVRAGHNRATPLDLHTMNTSSFANHPIAALALAVLMCGAAATAHAQTAKKPAPKAPAAHAKQQAAPSGPAPASAEQVEAAQAVYYGVYDCEFNQKIKVAESVKYPSYVELSHGNSAFVMKPVMSSTGALRLEDVSGQTLLIQIANKSMLMNVRTAQRIVDDCVNATQREMALRPPTGEPILGTPSR